MLKELCVLNGVSGNEEKVSEFVRGKIKVEPEEITTLASGSVVVQKKGKKTPHKKLMIFAHMDEVGFIVSDITEEGFLKFETVGGIDERILLSKKVYVGDAKIPGVIGIKAVHLTSKEERKNAIPVKNMYVDIGATSKADACKYVSLGDYISFDSETAENNNRLLAKALDDRVGVSMLVELVNSECEYDFVACFDTLEEVGARGALTAANFEKPDYALILEGTTCSDISDTPENLRSTVLGDGPALSVRDMGTCYSDDFNKFIMQKAAENGIKYQLKKTHRGGNDSSTVKSAASGVKISVISMPIRYIHSPTGILDKGDYENGLSLVKKIIDSIGEL